MKTYERTEHGLVIRENGKFCSVNWFNPEILELFNNTEVGDRWTEVDIPEMLANVSTQPPTDRVHKCCGKCHSENTYTIQFKVTAYYDVNISADSFEESFEKAKNIPAYDIVTEGELVDIVTPVSVEAVLKQS